MTDVIRFELLLKTQHEDSCLKSMCDTSCLSLTLGVKLEKLFSPELSGRRLLTSFTIQQYCLGADAADVPADEAETLLWPRSLGNLEL